MTVKYKISDLAKDFNLSKNELVERINQYVKEPKKGTSTLNEQELNILIESITQEHQVDSFDAYFASRNAAQDKAPKKEEKKAASPNKAAKESKPTEEAKDRKKEKKPAASAKEQPKKQAAALKQEQPKKQQTAPVQEKPKKKPAKPREKLTQVLKHKPKIQEQKASEIQPQAEANVHHVDTRTAQVNLEKYNDRYESIAPNHRIKDNYQNKQKFSKRPQKGRNKKVKQETEAEKLQRLALERARKQQLKVSIPDEIVVSELAQRLKVTATQVIQKLIPLGVMVGLNETIDFDTASLVADELGAKVEKEVVVTIEERLFTEQEDDPALLQERDPVVVVMGHVDHGKTSLLDKIRHTNVISGEAGGITQHIGAYKVALDDYQITFLDTPGHEAFTAMRMRGANMTDIAVLVVAADDGIMPQTVEAIHHAKAADVSIIVAINKIDRPEANVEKVKQELTEHELIPEEWGGDVICLPVSAKTGEGIPELLEMIHLVADVKELKANPNRLASGTVVEAYLDKGRGPVATLLVQNGTLKEGDVLIAGTAVGHLRTMRNDRGEFIKEAGPSMPVEITGLMETPQAGEPFRVVENERLAREFVERRKFNEKQEQFNQRQKVTLDNLFSQIEEGEMKELALVVKADVQGSVEAVKQSLEKLSNDEVRVRVIHGAAGGINKSDVMLANASNAIIIGFNVRPDAVARAEAEEQNVEMRTYRVIYDAIEEVEQAIKGMLAPKTREVQLGSAEVRQVYKISSVGNIAGCYVTEGKVKRTAQVRVVRDGIVIAEDEMASLKRFKDDAKEVVKGYECGITLQKYGDIKEGDIFEFFEIEEYRE